MHPTDVALEPVAVAAAMSDRPGVHFLVETTQKTCLSVT
jgi:hypothetical protein